jgi:hypothetical protein
MHKSQIEREERSTFLPGSEGPSSLSAASAGSVVIPFPVPKAAAWDWEEEAGEFDDTFESIGSLAVRLVTSWQLPRLVVFVAADPEGGEPDRLP